MNSFQNISRENLHHAHLVISDLDFVERELLEILKKNLNIETSANEFFFFEKYDKFLVDDARKIFDLHLRKTPEDKIQVIVLAFNFITREAQNAILKMLEEPKDRTHFFLVAPSKSLFLETIFSRVLIVEICKPEIKNQKSKKFFSMNMGERVKFIATLIKDIKDEKQTKQDAIDLLSDLEIELYKNKNMRGLKVVTEARKYMNLNGASIKILLENVALNV